MKSCFLFQFTVLALLVVTFGCASAPQALVPSSSQVLGLAVIPQTKAAESALGRHQPLIVQDVQKQSALFRVLEINKEDASVSSGDTEADFIVKWKMRSMDKMDKSQLYLSLNNPRTLIYESDLGGTTKKYVIKVETDDADIVWNAIGVLPPGLQSRYQWDEFTVTAEAVGQNEYQAFVNGKRLPKGGNSARIK